jgi:hypothetical protein
MNTIPSFNFGNPALEIMHREMKELVAVKSDNKGSWHYSAEKGLHFIPGIVHKSVYKKEYDGFQYRVICPNQFSFIQTIRAGQVVPVTSNEISCIN